MSQDWAYKTAEKLLRKDLIASGISLFLGAADTGKTTLAIALTKQLAEKKPVGFIDADIGQSHIGPPTTVGWAVVDDPQVDFSQLTPAGINFVGDVTPIGHLLQLTAAITQSVQQVSPTARLIIIDTPGLVHGPAAAALWWSVQRILQPRLIVAVQRNDELNGILEGLKSLDTHLELIGSPPEIPIKSPQSRRTYRQRQFRGYFQDSCLYDIGLTKVAVQTNRKPTNQALVNRIVALRDGNGTDLAIGIVVNWQIDRDTAVVKAPKVDINRVRCLVVGDTTVEITDE